MLRKVTGGLPPSLCAGALMACGPPLRTEAGSLYAPWPNGPPQSPDFFRIAVWWQHWPERFGEDDGELDDYQVKIYAMQ